MAITSGYFNSVNGDRKYNADQMSEYFEGIINEGVCQHIDGGLAVTAGTGLSVNVAAGKAFIGKKWIRNDASLTLTISAASASYARIDAVVLRRNNTTRTCQIVVKSGTPAASPAAPTMTRNSTTYEMALAYVNVAANATSVTVTDKRADTTVCGWATVAESVPGEIDAQLNAMKTGFDGVVYDSPVEMVQGCDNVLLGISDNEDEKISDIRDALGYTITKSVNQWNPDEENVGYSVSNSGDNYGELVESSNYVTSGLIPVIGGTIAWYYNNNASADTVSRSTMFRVAEYDRFQNCIKVSDNWAASPYTLQSATRYVRVVIQTGSALNEIVLNPDNVSSIYFTSYEEDVESYDLVKEMTDYPSVQNLLGFEKCGVNKYNPSEVQNNTTISNASKNKGEVIESSGYYTSGYIDVVKDDKVSYYSNNNLSAKFVSKSTAFRIAEYDTNHKCLVVSSNWPSSPYTVQNAATRYLRICVNASLSSRNIMVTVNYPDLTSIIYKAYDSKDRLSNLDKITPSINLVLPSKIPVVKNMPLYIYNRAIAYGDMAVDDVNFAYDVFNDKLYKDRIRIVKSSAGSSDQNIIVYDDNDEILTNEKTSIVSIDNTANGSKSASVLIIGDSKTEANWKGDKLKELIDADSNLTITFLGTQTSGEIHNEGYSGKSIVDFCRTASFGTGRPNIFYNSSVSGDNKFDFAQAVATLGSTPDIVIIDLGANDWNIAWDTVKGCYDSIISSIHSVSNSIKVVISIQEGVSIHQLVGNKSNDHAVESQFYGLSTSQNLIGEYDGRESEKIYILPQYVNVDPYNDFPICELPVSEVNEMKVRMCIDHIHPGINNSAWNQNTAYDIYAWVKRTDGANTYAYGCVKANTGVDPLTDDGTYWAKCENANAGYFKIAYMYYYMLWYLLTL